MACKVLIEINETKKQLLCAFFMYHDFNVSMHTVCASCTSTETGSGHLGHVLSKSSGSDPDWIPCSTKLRNT